MLFLLSLVGEGGTGFPICKGLQAHFDTVLKGAAACQLKWERWEEVCRGWGGGGPPPPNKIESEYKTYFFSRLSNGVSFM